MQNVVVDDLKVTIKEEISNLAIKFQQMNNEYANTKEGIDVNDLKDAIQELDAKVVDMIQF